jgi:hypothetical protein
MLLRNDAWFDLFYWESVWFDPSDSFIHHQTIIGGGNGLLPRELFALRMDRIDALGGVALHSLFAGCGLLVKRSFRWLAGRFGGKTDPKRQGAKANYDEKQPSRLHSVSKD